MSKPGTLSSRQMKELRDAFDLFDRDGNGFISLSELRQVLDALNFKVTDELLQKVMKEMDTDKSGAVDFNEFVEVMRGVYQRKFSDEEMRRTFACFDQDKSGYITADEFRKVLRRLGRNVTDRHIDEILRQVDTDHDGKISYEEFVHLIQHA